MIDLILEKYFDETFVKADGFDDDRLEWLKSQSQLGGGGLGLHAATSTET
jgi:hypothetical protein